MVRSREGTFMKVRTACFAVKTNVSNDCVMGTIAAWWHEAFAHIWECRRCDGGDDLELNDQECRAK